MKPGSLCAAERKILSRLLLAYPEFITRREIEIMLWPDPDGGPDLGLACIYVALTHIRSAVDPWWIETVFRKQLLRLRFPHDAPASMLTPREAETFDLIQKYPGIQMEKLGRLMKCAPMTVAQNARRLKKKLAMIDSEQKLIGRAYHGYRLVSNAMAAE